MKYSLKHGVKKSILSLVLFAIPFLWPQYSEQVPVIFLILLGAKLMFLLSTPIHNAILYYYSQPKFFVFLSLVQLTIVIAGGWFFISEFRTTGAAVTVFISMLTGLVVSSIWLLTKLK